MLRFFRINDPYRLVFIFLILIAIRFTQGFFVPSISYYELKWLLLGEWLGKGFTMYDQTYDYTGPLSAMVYKVLNLLFGKSQLAFQIISSFLIIIQAGIFNALLLKNKVYDENSYLPAFLYVSLAIGVPDSMTLSPQLMSLTFILLTFRNVIRRIDNEVTDELFLSSGLYIGIASMIFLPASVYFLVFLFSLILFSTAVPRRLILYFYGFVLIFVLCGLYYYLAGSFYSFFERAVLKGILIPPKEVYSNQGLLLIASPFLLILLLSFLKKLGASRPTNFQQKVEQVIWIIFLGAIATFLISNERTGVELLFMIPVLAYFWTHYFILLKRRFFVAIMPGFLIIGLIVFSCYSYQNLTVPIIVSSNAYQNEKTMVLGEKLETYVESSMLTPCFEKSISRDLTQEINTYEGAINFHEIFKKTQPEIIIDEMEVMPHILMRFPYIEAHYEKTGINRYQKISN